MICQGCGKESGVTTRLDDGRNVCLPCWEEASKRQLWPHQARGLDALDRAIAAGERAICVAAPCGAGKTTCMATRADHLSARGKRMAIFTNRKILTTQASGTLSRFDVSHGVMAAGHDPSVFRDVQVCSLQTISKRVFQRQKDGRQDAWELPNVDEVHIDEAHSNTAETARAVIDHYKFLNVPVVGWTATPVGLAGIYEKLIIAGTNSELRKCGALVRCDVYAPTEPDMRGVKFNAVGEYVLNGMRKRVMQCTVFGDVFDNWKRLNPFALPTLLWAPGIDESRWFVDQWKRKGVTAAHIDGDTPEEERKEIFEASKEGRITVLSSCGVLREGFDAPHIAHGILCQPCGGLSTFLQIVGRILRAHEGKDLAILQDHAGAWHRHGSPNADREWDLNDTDKSISEKKRKQREQGEDPEPICCPKCGGVRKIGPTCPFCGHEHVKSCRYVRMTDGTLKKMLGPVVKKKAPKDPDQEAWKQALYAAARSNRTLDQARGIFKKNTGRYVPLGLQNMPPEGSQDWNRRAGDVYPWLLKSRKRKEAA